MKIENLNPWWKTGKIPKEFSTLEKRALFKEIIKYIKEKQIIVLTGLRRTGKTTLMHHVIDYLLKFHPKENIFYYSFDLMDDNIENILESYINAVEVSKEEKLFVFLDEIQKHKNWENELKLLYDNFKNIKFFISGSSTLFVEKKSKESLAGRTFSFTLKPLSFKEYLKLKKIEINKKKITIYKKELEKYLNHYLRTGGFPELLEIYDKVKIDKYIKELVIDRIIYIDIPKSFEIDEPELLQKILSVISANPGMIVEYESLADDFQRNRKTISNYIFYLEKAFLIKKLYNYSKNLLTSEKKLKKIYPTSTAFSYLFNSTIGKIIETVILMNFNFQFFSRDKEKEVDFIKTEKRLLPIEVKYKQKIKEKEIKPILSFMDKNNLKQSLIITKDYETEKIIKNKKIKFIPLWKYLFY